MNLETQLNNLQERLTNQLRQLPGATALYLLGSRAGGHADGYADLDLQVCTNERGTRSFWPQFLERVGAIEAAFPLNGAADNTAFAIFYQGESYYHKVDIGLCGGDAGTLRTEGCIQLWSQPPAPQIEMIPPNSAYNPAYGSVGYQVLDELIANERYLRARKRRQDLLCWRFIRVKPEQWLRLKYEQLQDWQPHEQPLTTWELKTFEGIMSACDRTRFTSQLDWSEPAAMDASLLWFTDEIIHLLQTKASAQHEALPVDIIARHRSFLYDELGHVSERHPICR